MSSKRLENFRRTTKRLLEQDRQYAACREYVESLSRSRRVSLAALLLAGLAAEDPEAAEAGILTDMATALVRLAPTISQRAITGAAPGEQSRVTETPAAASAPSAVPTAAFKP